AWALPLHARHDLPADVGRLRSHRRQAGRQRSLADHSQVGHRTQIVSDERADLILNMVRAIRAEQLAQREKLDEIISRLGALEREVAALTLRFAEMKVDFANLSVWIDNLDRRVRRIEQRLDLVEIPAPS